MSATLRYEDCSDFKISPARQYKDPIFTRHDVHPYVTNNQASLFTAIKLELIQTCPSTKIQSITASETCLKFLQTMIMIHRKSEDLLSTNMSDLTQVITYKQTCRRQKREMSTTLNYSYTVVQSAINCISNSDCSRTVKPPIAANTFTPHLHIEYTISRG